MMADCVQYITWCQKVKETPPQRKPRASENATKWTEILQVALQRWIRRAEIYRPRGKHSGHTASSRLEGLLKRKLKKKKQLPNDLGWRQRS